MTSSKLPSRWGPTIFGVTVPYEEGLLLSSLMSWSQDSLPHGLPCFCSLLLSLICLPFLEFFPISPEWKKKKDSKRKFPNHRNHNLLGDHYHFTVFHSLEAGHYPCPMCERQGWQGHADKGQGTLYSCGHQIHLPCHFFIFCLMEWTPSVLSPPSSL